MTLASWFWIALSAFAAAVFATLIWLGGPLLVVGDAQPLDSVEARAGLIGVIWLIVFVAVAWRIGSRWRAASALQRAMTESVADDSDAPVLKRRMEEALATLRRVNKSPARALYDLPWYLIIGPPGAGKTTALVNSGLKFPLAGENAARAVQGVGGTRYCDWWFTDQAVLVDTAGRYTTQDSDARADRKSWLAFLAMLRENRPLQPINGVIVAISIADVLNLPPPEVKAHADAIRRRLDELREELKVSFPVYAVFTKLDLISGFTQYFADLDKTKRQAVWGATFQSLDKGANDVRSVPEEFNSLIQRVSERMAERLQDEPDPRARVTLFGLPAQLGAIRKPIADFLNDIFGDDRKQGAATLRGFYLTSGTQEGTPFDAVIGALKRSYGVENTGALSFSGPGKSYFLHDLLANVVFGEAGWVSTNIAAVRRRHVIRLTAFGLIGLGAAGILALWWMSFDSNASLIDLTRRGVDAYAAAAAPVIATNPIRDANIAPVYEVLDGLLNLPAGYAHRDESAPLASTFGLAERSRVQDASVRTYQAALERLFRPRLALDLEKQIRKLIDDPEALYPKLKVYLMLGGKAPVVDKPAILSQFDAEWEREFPGGPYAAARARLRDHLQAMLELDTGGAPAFDLDGPLVERAQATLARMRVAQRAYTLLRSEAINLPIDDWIASKKGGPDMARVFETASRSSLDTVRVPKFYTYSGFRLGLLEPLRSVRERLEKEKWVLGRAAEQPGVNQQYENLNREVLAIYDKDFINAWNAALFNLQLRPLLADKPGYLGLKAAAGPDSPLMKIFESVRDETALTRNRLIEGAQPGGAVEPPNAIDPPAKTQQKAGEPPPGAPGAEVEANFSSFLLLVDGAPPRRPMDSLLENLSQLYQSLRSLDDPTQGKEARDRADRALEWLHFNVSRLTPPLSVWIDNVVKDGLGTTSASSITQLADAMAQEVTSQCLQVANGKYPFAAKGPDVPITDFARLFMPNGIIDKFLSNSLAPYVNMTVKPWTWRPPPGLTRKLPDVTLHQFEQAAEIRDAFFSAGDSQINVNVEVRMLTLGANASSTTLIANGGPPIVSQQAASAVSILQWPGAGAGRASITLAPDQPDQTSTIDRQGPWALFRLIDSGTSTARGDTISVGFIVGARDVSYQFKSNSANNPLNLSTLRQFKCPSGL